MGWDGRESRSRLSETKFQGRGSEEMENNEGKEKDVNNPGVTAKKDMQQNNKERPRQNHKKSKKKKKVKKKKIKSITQTYVTYLQSDRIHGNLAAHLVVKDRVPEDQRKIGVHFQGVLVFLLLDAGFDEIQTPWFWYNLKKKVFGVSFLNSDNDNDNDNGIWNRTSGVVVVVMKASGYGELMEYVEKYNTIFVAQIRTSRPSTLLLHSRACIIS